MNIFNKNWKMTNLNPNRVFTLSMLLICNLFALQSFSQCTNSSQWGGASAPVDLLAASISNCNYAGEFASVTDVIAGNEYVVTSANCNDYITVYDDLGEMVGHGTTPFQFTAPMSGIYAVHFNMDDNCGTEGACRETSISCFSCGATPGCTDPIATNYDDTATYNDCSCILASLANDDCIDATNLDLKMNLDGTCNLIDLSPYSGASGSIAEVAPSPSCSDGAAVPLDVWYSLTVPASGVVTFEFISTPGFSSVMECYTGVCGNLTAYDPVMCNNESSRTFIDMTEGDLIYFRVWDYGSNDVGNHEICIKREITGCTDPAATNYDPNATFESGICTYPTAGKPCLAQDLILNAVCSVGDNTLAGMEPGEPAGTCFSGINNAVWFKFVADAETTSISTDFDGYTSTDTEVTFYSAGDCLNYTTFTEIDCDQDGGIIENYNSIISGAPTTVGETYYIQVSGWNGTQGTFCIEATSAPVNNDICGSLPMSCGEVLTGNTTGYSLSTTGLPATICGSGELTAPNAFFQINGTGDEFVLSLCNSSFDTRLDVFCLVGGDCDNGPDFVCVTGNDDTPSCGSVTASEVRFSTLGSSKYFVMVHGYGNTTGAFEISLECNTASLIPNNQDCNDNGNSCRPMGTATLLSVDTVCNLVSASNAGAAQAIVTPPCAISATQSVTDVWYRFNTGMFTGFEIEVTEGTATDVRYALYENCGGAPMFCDESVFYGLDPNTDYYIQLFTAKGDEGSFDLCLTSAQLCAFLTSPNGNNIDINTELTWTPAFTATGYRLMLGTSIGSDDVMPLTDLGSSLSYDPGTLDYNTTYFATILPYNNLGEVESCPSFSFTTQCPVIESNVVNMIDGSCYGTADAALDIAVNGGEGPYSFEWSGPNAFVNTAEDIVQITGGVYDLVITDDNNGCSINKSFEVQPMSGMSSMTNIVDEACGSDGSAEILVFDGLEPYTYQWSTGSLEAATTNVPSGMYEVTVTDANACTAVFDSITIGDGGELSASAVNVIGIGCGSSSGSITVSPVTGIGPYDYSWSSITGSVSGTIIGINGSYAINSLPVGSYNVTITDANSCVGYVNDIGVQYIDEIEMDVSQSTNPDCYGANNGEIVVSAIVGQAPYQFAWSNGLIISSSAGTEAISGIGGGIYSVTITDANGCTGITQSIEIDEPAALNVVIHSVESPTCFGETTGQVYVDIEGGSDPLTYAWSNGYTNEDLIGVGSGNYLLTITDGNGCTTVSPLVTVDNPTAIEINLNSIESVTCFGENAGSINTGIFGGSPPYDIAWNNGATSSNLDNLAGGDYQCTIIDAVGCEIISPLFTVQSPESAIEITLAGIDNSLCNGFESGSIDVTVNGGTEPYEYHWSNGTTTEDLDDLSSGNYLLTVTDVNDCVFISEIIFVDEPDELQATSNSTADVNEMSDGTATLSVSGGTMPYDYNWDSNTGNQTMATATGLAAGSYMVTVSDGNGCMMVTSVIVEAETEVIISTKDITLVKRLELSPNPTDNEAQLLIELSETKPIQVEVFDLSGKKVLNPQVYEARQLLTIIDLSAESAGVYVVKINIGGELTSMMLVKN